LLQAKHCGDPLYFKYVLHCHDGLLTTTFGIVNNLWIPHAQKFLSKAQEISESDGVRQRGLACLVSPLRGAGLETEMLCQN
jgi:predicted outer membrane lipoprotein